MFCWRHVNRALTKLHQLLSKVAVWRRRDSPERGGANQTMSTSGPCPNCRHFCWLRIPNIEQMRPVTVAFSLFSSRLVSTRFYSSSLLFSPLLSSSHLFPLLFSFSFVSSLLFSSRAVLSLLKFKQLVPYLRSTRRLQCIVLVLVLYGIVPN